MWVDHDGVDENSGDVDGLSGQLGVGQSFDLGDHNAAFVVSGVRLVECPEGAALLLVGEVAVGVGCSGSDDRNVYVHRRVEQVVIAVDLHQLHEVVGGGVHFGAFMPRVGVGAQPDFGQHTRLPGGGGSVHLEQHSGWDVEGLDLIIVDQLADQRRVEFGAARGVGAGEHAAQLPGPTQVVNPLDAVHVTGSYRMQGRQVCRRTGFFVTLPDRLEDGVGTAKPR